VSKNEGIEEQRLALQSSLDAGKSKDERNRLGQFATPIVLARAIVREALAYLPVNTNIRFLDPAFGTGSFYSALTSLLPESRIEEARSYEVDPYFGLPSQSLWKDTRMKLEIGDFMACVPSKEQAANLIICNPPYVRHHHIEQSNKRRLQALVEQHFGYHLSGLTGLYCYFLLISQLHMSRGGIGAWLIPSEFMDVNYGRQIKRFLIDKVTLLRIHRFNTSVAQFQDALVSSTIVFFQNSTPMANHEIAFTYGQIDKPILSENIDRMKLKHVAKWTSLPSKEHRHSVEPKATLADFFKIKRGLATGCNNFFVLTPEQVVDFKLPRQFLRPILPSPRMLAVNEVTAKTNGEPAIENPLFLLDCPLPESVIKADFPTLWTYLFQGMANEIHKGYICRNRQPWYSHEVRPAAPFLCTYMGRPTKKSNSPFRFILNESNATATNAYLMLYPKGKFKRAIESDYKFRHAVWQGLSSIGPEMLIGKGRLYGGGLHKMEPKELANVHADAILHLLSEGGKPDAQRTLFPPELDIEGV
jgi:adenine-specific DNA-methyltransferase